MLIGQSVLAITSPGATYYSPWMPRQGDVLTVVLEIVNDSGGSYTLQCVVETKNHEDSDASASTLGSVTGTAAGTWTPSSPISGCLELVRYKLTAIATSAAQWIHFRSDAPIWQPN